MGLLSLLGVAALAFLSTNVDNLVVTTAQVAAAKPGRVRRILSGQMIGFVLIVAVSALAAVALLSVPTRWVGLLGVVPIALGVRGLLALRSPDGRAGVPGWPLAGGAITSALVTMGNGGDNLAVYIPLLRSANGPDTAAIVGLFLVLDLLLLTVARRAGRSARTLRALERGGAYATPVVYLLIGVIVLLRSKTFGGL